MRGTRIALKPLVLSLGLLCLFTLPTLAVELQIPISTPRLMGIAAEIPASEGTARLSAVLRYDAKGKVVGDATIDGQPASVRGALKKTAGGWAYSVTFKGLGAPVNCKISGLIGSGVAAIRYKGPRGGAKVASFPVALQASEGASSGALSGAFQVDARGKITGTGQFSSGLGNDPEGDGKVTGKLTLTSISLKFKSGKQTVTFKGEVQGAYLVGTLKIKSPPARETIESFSIPLDGSFSLPPQGGHDEPETEQLLFTINLDGTSGFFGSVTVNRVTTSSGKVFNRAYVEISSGGLYYRNLDGLKLDANLPLPPTATGKWLSFPLEVYDVQNAGHQFKKSGTFTIDVTHAGPGDHAGTWSLRDNALGLSASGTWSGTTELIRE